jgi:hypothetical protein
MPATDPQMIQPPPALKDRLPSRSLDPHMLDRAEEALQELAGGYITQMGEEISEMARVVKTAREPGTDMASALRTVTMAAHGIKGHGRSLGYPLLGEIMGSLDAFLRDRRELDARGFKVVDARVGAARRGPWSRATSRAAAAMSAAN